ncbi:hypothetical protein [Pseudaestuariivita sp.]|uniref:hypothetical protein n=1 Tax=Pseudaestuariivita sp. TaxID=2211669 RepID=UPI004059A20E
MTSLLSSDTHALLADVPEDIAAKLGAYLPELVTCEAMAGAFDLELLKASGFRAPAVFVSILAARQAQTLAGGLHTFDLSMAAYVATSDRTSPRSDRDAFAKAIGQALMVIIPDKRWGKSHLGAAKEVALRSLVNRNSKRTSASLVAISWTQPVTLKSVPDGQPIDLSIYLGEAPEIGADHEGDYALVAGEEKRT